MARQVKRLRLLRAPCGAALVCLLMRVTPFVFETSDAYAEENLGKMLRNAGFEYGSDGQPAEWRCFVVPAEGVEALWDADIRRSGERSVMLHIETPYQEEVEVYDNWYQHIPNIPVAKKLLLSGYIKSEDVTEAAIWLQCWRGNSREVLRFSTTSIAYPISGSVDWTRVETSIVPPPETSFMTVRCVVAGKGAAWFDDLLLAPQQEDEEDLRSEKADTESKSGDPEALKQLLEAHKILLETNRSLAENAAGVTEKLAKLQEELNELRRLLEEWLNEEENKTDGGASQPEPVPPFRPAAGKESASPNSELLQ